MAKSGRSATSKSAMSQDSGRRKSKRIRKFESSSDILKDQSIGTVPKKRLSSNSAKIDNFVSPETDDLEPMRDDATDTVSNQIRKVNRPEKESQFRNQN